MYYLSSSLPDVTLQDKIITKLLLLLDPMDNWFSMSFKFVYYIQILFTGELFDDYYILFFFNLSQLVKSEYSTITPFTYVILITIFIFG